MFSSLKWVLLSLLVVQAVCRETDHCYVDEDDPYLQFASKTAYHVIQDSNTGYQTIPDCTPIQVWALVRHGTRYPSKNVVLQLMTLADLRNQIIYNHESRQNGHLCDADLENLKQWSWDPSITTDVASYLAPQGTEDMDLHARRIRSSFPDLFPPVVSSISSENYKFRSTDTQRTQASMEAFMSGLFNRVDIPAEEPTGNDTLLRLSKYCQRWTEEVDENPETHAEANQFAAGPEFQELVLNVSRRLGFLFNISTASVLLMYDMCRFDKAWKVGDVSPWCAIFSDDELRVLEYHEDLGFYYEYGYGNAINANLGCPPLQDMFRHFQKLEGGDYFDEPKGIFYFAHTGTLQPLITALGLAKDSSALRANNYNSSTNRQWRTSKIGSFAGNIVAVFYKCNTGIPNKVMLYMAEKPVLLEGCKVGLCDWEYLKTMYGAAAFNCNLDFCNTNSAISSRIMSTMVIFTAISGSMVSNHFWP